MAMMHMPRNCWGQQEAAVAILGQTKCLSLVE
jgi:hypothetical protein